MDIETAGAIETLRTDIHRVEREVLRVGKTLSAKMHELNDDTGRHANIQFESVRADIRMVAEHLVALGSNVDSLRR